MVFGFFANVWEESDEVRNSTGKLLDPYGRAPHSEVSPTDRSRGSPFHDSMTHDLMTLTKLKDDSRFMTPL